MNMESGKDEYSMALFLYHIFLISRCLFHIIGLEKNSLDENRSIEEGSRRPSSGVRSTFRWHLEVEC